MSIKYLVVLNLWPWLYSGMNEFDVIDKYFAPLCPYGLDNDAAVLSVPEGHELIVTSDTLNAGTHFLAGSAPEDIAHKALRVNLSDLASMAAAPLAYQLNIAFPEKPAEEWLVRFTAALKKDQEEFGIICSGGDTTSIDGALSISITAFGTAPKGNAWKRSGARDGDALVLLGEVGLAGRGLEMLRGKEEEDEKCINAYLRPYPYIREAQEIRGLVNAAIDVSDGLVADLGHICKASKLGARVRFPNCSEQDLTAGDDYALLLAVPQGNIDELFKSLPDTRVVGEFTSEISGVEVLDEFGAVIDFSKAGWTHF